MHEEVKQILARSPQPLPWTIAMFVLAAGAIMLHSAVIALILGVVIGVYFGGYYGRGVVLEAWRREMELKTDEVRLQREERLTPCTD